MKKYIIFTLSLICTLFVASCSNDVSDSYDDATILLSKKTIEYGKDGGSETFTVTVNKKNNFIAQWKSPVDWAKVSTSDNVVTVTVTPNKTANTRTAEILVFTQNGGLKRYVDITQTATDLIFNITPDRVQFTRFGGDKEVRITTNNTDWMVEGGADWFKIEEVRPFGIIKLTATENKLDDERAAVITIKSGTEEKKINVIQNGVAELILPYQNFGAFMSELIEFEEDRGHRYQYIPKGSGVSESHTIITNSYLIPKISLGCPLGVYSAALVEHSIPIINTEKINEFLKNYSALLVDNGYEKETDIEYRKGTEDKYTDISATLYPEGVLFNLYYNQAKPMPTFDKFPYGFMVWGSAQDKVEEYEDLAGSVLVPSDGMSLKYNTASVESDIAYRMYLFNGLDNMIYKDLAQIVIGVKDYTKMFYIGKDGRPHQTEEFLALLEKENFKYLLRSENGRMITYVRPSPKGGYWVTACAVRLWSENNEGTINLWEQEYGNPEEVSSLSYIDDFKTRVDEKMKRADVASQNSGSYILR